MMGPKDLNKKNFILWYSLYASQKELEIASRVIEKRCIGF